MTLIILTSDYPFEAAIGSQQPMAAWQRQPNHQGKRPDEKYRLALEADHKKIEIILAFDQAPSLETRLASAARNLLRNTPDQELPPEYLELKRQAEASSSESKLEEGRKTWRPLEERLFYPEGGSHA